MEYFNRKVGTSKIIIGPGKVENSNLSARKLKMIYHFILQHLEMKGIRSLPGRGVRSVGRAEKLLNSITVEKVIGNSVIEQW